jgi:tetratricopeptide (TPR) repeat protein
MLNSPRVTDDPASQLEAHQVADDPASELEAHQVADDPACEVEAYEPTPTQRAQTLCDLGRFAAAAEAASQAIADEPRNSHAWCLMAQAQLGQNRAPAALVAAQAACRLKPADEAPHRLASLVLGSLGRDDEAAAAAAQATEHAPQSWRAHARLADCLAALPDRLPEARQAAERALELEPGQPGPHLAIGRVALAAGRDTDATSAFCAAMGVDPQCVEAHSELSRLQSRDVARSWASLRLPLPRLGRRRERAVTP